MRIYQHSLGLLLLILLNNCSMKDHRNYNELHEHKGNKKYEIVSILDQDYLIREVLLDSVKNQLIVNTKTTPIKQKYTDYRRIKVSLSGVIYYKVPNYTLLNVGCLW